MATPSRQAPSPVTKALLAQPQRFSYEQVVRLLQWQGIAKPQTRPHLSLGFPAVDVVSLADQGDQMVITTTLLGLYGASSPLPTFYTEALLEEAAEDGSATRDFYDLLNQPLYHHYFQAWTKYQLMLRWVERRDEMLIERLYALVGLGALPSEQASAAEQLPYAGLLNLLSRSSLGLETLLTQVVGCPVEIEPFIACWQAIPPAQQCGLGVQGHWLGEECYLGTHCLDSSSTCRLHIRISDPETFAELLPNQPRYSTMVRFLRHYLLDPLDLQLWLWPEPQVIPPAILHGDSAPLLGINCWLGDLAQCPAATPWVTQLPLGVH